MCNSASTKEPEMFGGRKSDYAQKSYLRRFFDYIINGFKQFFWKGNQLAIKRNEGFFKIKLGEEVITQLAQMFSDSDFLIPSGFVTVVEIPVSIGKQLYAACIEAILREKEAQDELLNELVNEHDEFRKILQELGGDFDYSTEYIEDDKTYIVGNMEDYCVVDGAETSSIATYRQKAKTHLKERKKFLHEAHKWAKLQNKHFAQQNFAQAQKHFQQYEAASKMVFKILFERCFKQISNQSCVDLHGFTVGDAIGVLDEFLDKNIEQLENGPVDVKSLMVITGQGKHSVGGIAKIKPAVCERLKARGLRYSMVNPGLLKVKIQFDSLLAEEVL
ncbi:uncharacterized protein LOC103313264 isoform X2 [Tribolium castaneum]|uniref:uncharacterized protein LOC103313264 isoform X2 n=1 Tax=Tribolium castaneum TaxID=7070 RepID=UPI00046C273C|nr:PREDICTED: uncharacterized protein LOC103313264 isoform X2 [Tribolium castaneum]XP_015835907.1 PREDICTED: uncharacterized protein LOC103313264 isoform X2 [Tribolium castaneum]|eukprot:XP_008194331.1 PREDICTED: uncharacterized protein LOC103313264 isoform X2 [Tribolium castaneum]